MTPEQLSALCRAFDLGTSISVEENHEGVLNRNYVLKTDRGQYFIKSVRDSRKLDIPYIAAVEQYMHVSGIPAVCMVKTVTGDLYLEADSEVFTVYPYIASKKLGDYVDSDFERMGSLLAQIHRAGSAAAASSQFKEKTFKEKDTTILREKLEMYRDKIQANEYKDTTDLLFLEYIDTKLRSMSELVPIHMENDTLVHGDYHARNLLFGEDRQITGVCDWEKAELSPRAYEIARSVQYICFEGDEDYKYDEVIAVQQAQAFMRGYNSVYPIAPKELQMGYALRLRKLVYSVWIEDQHYLRGDTRSNKFIPHETRLIKEFTSPHLVDMLVGSAKI